MELIRQVRVRVDGGLHARPAAEVVRIARGFTSEITLENGATVAAARSSLKLLMLGVKEGQEITLRVKGEDAEPAIEALASFLGTAEPHAASPAAPDIASQPAPAQPLAVQAGPAAAPPAAATAGLGGTDGDSGIGASPGRAIGPVFLFRQPEPAPEPANISAGAVGAELARASAAFAEVAARCREGAAGEGGAVMAALAEIVADTDWSDAVTARIKAGEGALSAIRASGAGLAAEIAALSDAYAAARAEDLRGATQLVALALQGLRPITPDDAPKGAVLVAEELSAVHLGHADLSHLAGVVTAKGARTGHAAILLRAAGIPAVFGLGAKLEALSGAALLALDGSTGSVLADPSPEAEAAFRASIAEAEAEALALTAFRDIAPATQDGVAVTVAANIASLKEAERAKAAGAMGVGLFRTEFLYLDRPDLPSEEEQLAVYSAVLSLFPGHDVIIRTLDIGGDKPSRSIPVAAEDNPFLGLRGIRLCLAHPQVFRTQLRALLRAAPKGRLLVMLPMIADPSEIRATRALIEAEKAALSREGFAYGDFSLGIMVETPAAVFRAAELAQEADFFSIGTNDLTQYVMAADRLNPAVAGLCRTENPAVLAAISATASAATAAGKFTGVCGEAASDPALIPFLLRAGVRELSMAPAAIPRAKRLITETTLSDSGT